MSHLFIGIDTRGTFTDLVIFQQGNITVHKTLSMPDDPSRAILQALEHLGILHHAGVIVHGSTLNTHKALKVREVMLHASKLSSYVLQYSSMFPINNLTHEI